MNHRIGRLPISVNELLAMDQETAVRYLFREHQLSPYCAICEVSVVNYVKLVRMSEDNGIVTGICKGCYENPEHEEQLAKLIWIMENQNARN